MATDSVSWGTSIGYIGWRFYLLLGKGATHRVDLWP